MPGTYLAGSPVVTIAAFAQQLVVITSKQRPRKLTIHGSDGAEYMFLLKVLPPLASSGISRDCFSITAPETAAQPLAPIEHEESQPVFPRSRFHVSEGGLQPTTTDLGNGLAERGWLYRGTRICGRMSA